MRGPIAILGVPTALGGHLAGMELRAGRAAGGRPARSRCGRDPGLAGLESDRTPATSPSIPGSGPTPIHGRRTGPRSREFLPRERDLVASAHRRPPRRPAADPRRRLHRPRRGDGRPPARPAGRRARDRLVRCPRRLQHARHDPVGQRLGHAVRDALRPRRPRPRRGRRRTDASTRRTPRCSAARCSTRPSRGCSRPRASRPSGAGMLGDDAGHGRARWLGAAGRASVSTASTSRSTWTASTRRAAGPSRCPSRTGSRSPRRSTAVRTLAAAMPVVGFGATGITLANGDVDATVDAVAILAEAALAGAAGLAPTAIEVGARSCGTRPRRGRARDESQLGFCPGVDDDRPAAVVGARSSSRRVAERGAADLGPGRDAAVGRRCRTRPRGA